MKRILLVVSLTLLFFQYGTAQNPFITSWTTTTDSESISIEISNGLFYDFNFIWKNAADSSEVTSGIHTSADGDFNTEFQDAGDYFLEITGDFPYFSDYPKDKLVDVNQWGDIVWGSMASTFRDWPGRAFGATDIPDLSEVIDMNSMLRNARNFNGDLSQWQVGNVTNMSDLFLDAVSFNSEIGAWDVGSVTNMRRMFFRCDSFNQDISGWDVSLVRNIEEMFSGADNFASDLSEWEITGVTSLSGLFREAANFNSDLNNWDVSQVTNMSETFREASIFNGNISDWDVGNVQSMEAMFNRALSFNGDISGWNVERVKNMAMTFENADAFNIPLNSWRVDSVTTMRRMFEGTAVFNQDLNEWNVERVTTMLRIFRLSNSFNGDVSTWNVGNTPNLAQMFSNARAFDQDLSAWDVSSSTTLSAIFNASNLSSQNYDKLLKAWSALPGLQPDVNFGANGIEACGAEAERLKLINEFGWNITDDGICNEATDILSYEVAGQVGFSTIDLINHEITFRYLDSLDATDLIPVFSISEGASISPESGTSQNFSNSETTPVMYTITAEDGITTQDWAVRLLPISSETDILGFEISASADLIETINIDEENHEVNVVMLPTESIRFAQPEIITSRGATISPASGSLIDLSSNVFTYSVTAEDGDTQQDWLVTVETPINTATDFLTFQLPGQVGTSEIDTAEHSILVKVQEDSQLSALIPSFTLSNGATSSPVSGITQDFSNQVNYTVTAEDGITTQDWQIIVSNSRPFITSWNVNGGIALEIGLNGSFAYDFNYEWKDEEGNTALSGRHESANGDFTTILPVGGNYTLEVNGDFPHFANYPKDQLLDVQQWGDIVWRSFNQSFRNWNGVDFSAVDTPDLSQGPDMFRAFSDNSNFNADLSRWDVSQVTSLQGLFNSCTNFNGDISQWNVENVINMESVFIRSGFNGDVSEWNTSNVTNMVNTFRDAARFDQDLSEWDISNVSLMANMLTNSGLSIQNYDKFLISIAGQTVQENVTLDAIGLSNCLGENSKQLLIDNSDWTINDEGTSCSSENDFLTFLIPVNQVGNAIIDPENHTVEVSVNLTADLTALIPTLTVSPNAITIPGSGVTQDFTDPVNYQVTSSDSTVQQWTVTVTNLAEANTETDILTFQLSEESLNRDIINTTNINSDLHVITLGSTSIATLTTVTPVITLSQGASISPSSEQTIDLSDSTETYIVTAEDGVTTQAWSVEVIDLVPANDLCSNAITVNVGDTVQTSSRFATSDAAIAPTCGTNRDIGLGIWYKITGTGEAFSINTCGGGTNFDTSLSVYTGTCETGLICLQGNDDACGTRSSVEFNSETDQEYFILVEGFSNSSTGNIELAVVGSPAIITPTNDDCEDAETLTVFTEGTGTPTNGNTTNAELFNRSNCDSFGAVNDVWFRFNSGANTQVQIDLELTDTDEEDSLVAAGSLSLAVYTSCDGDSFVCDRSTDDQSVDVTPGTDYWIQIWNEELADEGTFTIRLNDGPNTAPELSLDEGDNTLLAVSRFVEQGSQIGIISANDQEGHAQLFSINAGNDEGISVIDSISGQLSIADTAALRSSLNNTFNLDILSEDQGPGGLFSEITITVEILDNNAPVFENDIINIDENTANGAIVGTLSAVDPDGDLIRFDEITSTLSGAFSLSNTGELSVSDERLLNFETDSVITLEVLISDDGPLNLTGTGNVRISLNDVNDAPTVSDSIFNISSGISLGSSVGVIRSNDQDFGQSAVFTIVSDESEGIFNLDSITAALTVLDAERLQTNGTRTYRLTVKATDNGTPALSDSAIVIINVFGDTAPIITSEEFFVDENTRDGTVIGTLQATDAEGDEIAFSLLESSLEGAFSVNASGEIAVSDQGLLDFETVESTALVVSATDAELGLLQSQAIIVIRLNDVNESFTVTGATFNIGSSAEDGSLVGQVIASDSDGDELTFSISSGNTDDIFTIGETTGLLTVNNSGLLNPAVTSQYNLLIEVTDGEFVSTVQVTVNVFINEAPVIAINEFDIDENNEVNALVGVLDIQDGDGILSIELLSGNELGIFEFDEESRTLRVADSVVLNHEEIREYSLLIRATDNGLGNVQTTETISVTINDINEFDPVVSDIEGGRLDENSPVGTEVAKINATDGDTSQSLTYEITAGDDEGNFVIDNNGQLTTQSVLDFEQMPAFALTVEISDDVAPIRTINRVIDININDVNETPVLTAIAEQNGSVGNEITFTAEATDPENDALTYSFAENTAQNGMEIEASTGEFSWTPAIGQFGEFSAIIMVSDGEFEVSDTVQFNIINNASDILTFALTEQTGAAIINTDEHTVAVEVAFGTDVSALVPAFTFSEGATSNPSSGITTDFTNPVTITVTAEDGTNQDWLITVTEAPSTESDILTFALAEQTGAAIINTDEHTVTVEVAFGTDVSALVPAFTLSEGATSDPSSGIVTDFTNPVTVTVTAEDGANQEWLVTVNDAPNTESDILTFALAEQTGAAIINNDEHTVAVEVAFGTDVLALVPAFSLSEGAISDPSSGIAINFTNPVTITVTAEDGITIQEWIVTVTIDSELPDTATDILTFALAEQTGAAIINSDEHTVAVEVAFGTDVSALVPAITLSEGATSDPSSGIAINFTNPVTITVTAEDGITIQEWVLTITIDGEFPDTATDILTFVLAEQTGAAIINTDEHTVAVKVAFGTDISALVPAFTLSEGATSDPSSGIAINFTNPVTITVTAEDGITIQEWVVTVTIEELITAIEEAIDLKVYPNPATDVLHVSCEVIVTAFLIDMNGRIIKDEKEGSDLRFDLTDIANGTYVLVIRNGEKIIRRKVSKH
ncbi:MAG: BspA family leucine-rich repeat surface protein [Cyclobacteriaceae bacterium]